MALSDVTAQIISMQSSSRGAPLSKVLKDTVRQRLQSTIIIYRLVKAITRSDTLASIAERKYGLFKPDERDKQRDTSEQKFKGYTVSSISQLQKQINTLTVATERNSALISTIMNDIGYFRGSRRVNPMSANINMNAIKIPLREKTVKGKIDKINEQLAGLHSGKNSGKTMGTGSSGSAKTTKEKVEDGLTIMAKAALAGASIFALYEYSKRIGKGLGLDKEDAEKNAAKVSALLAAASSSIIREAVKTGIRTAIPVAGIYYTGKKALEVITGAEERARKRKEGLPGVDNPVLEKLSKEYDPLIESAGFGALAYAALAAGGMILGGGKFVRGKISAKGFKSLKATATAARTAARAAETENFYKKVKEASQFSGRYQKDERNLAKQTLAARDAGLPLPAGAKETFKVSTVSDTARASARETRRAGVSSYQKVKTKIRGGARKYLPFNDKISKIGAWLSKSKFIQKLSPLLLADLVFQYTRMRSLNNEYRSGNSEISYSDYKEEMTGLLSNFTNTIGASGAGALVGFVLGTAVFPPGGGLLGAVAGGVAGGVASLAASVLMEGSAAEGWMGAKLFSLLFEGEKLDNPMEDIARNNSGDNLGGSIADISSRTQAAPQVSKVLNSDDQFMKEVQRVSDKFQIDPADLLAVMYRESGLDPRAENPKNGATGLIQFTRSTAKWLGTSTGALKTMSRTQQMKYVEKYFDTMKLPQGSNRGEIYSYVFLPGIAKKKGAFLAAANDPNTAEYYKNNIGLDINRDGIITIDDLTAATSMGIGDGGMQVASSLSQAPSGDNKTLVQVMKLMSGDTGDSVTAIKQDLSSHKADIALTGIEFLGKQQVKIAKEVALVSRKAAINQESNAFVTNQTLGEYA
jgi:hypothetical protein